LEAIFIACAPGSRIASARPLDKLDLVKLCSNESIELLIAHPGKTRINAKFAALFEHANLLAENRLLFQAVHCLVL
jgi:hypothetical protein